MEVGYEQVAQGVTLLLYTGRAVSHYLRDEEKTMKTVTIEVGNLLSALSALGVEKQLMKLPGVHKAEVNYVAAAPPLCTTRR